MSMITTPRVLTLSLFLRLALLVYGIFQDAYSPIPYTDIDYYVFTDAARYTYQHRSPYLRETYRYTPLLAWLLIPTAWSPQWLWFSLGKILFALADVTAGWLIALVLQRQGMEINRALKFACVWLLNPMVATISTRGSSEGLLGVMVIALLWAAFQRRIVLAGILLGLAVHFKIYPFIYGVSIIWYLATPSPPLSSSSAKSIPEKPTTLRNLLAFFNLPRLTLLFTSLLTFTALNTLMYAWYGYPFLQHTFIHHLTRIDHRHNFSAWNTLLHLSSAYPSSVSGLRFEKLAFVPQLLLSAIFIPLVLAKRDLAGAMLCQTWAFVAFNKVVTSQVSAFVDLSLQRVVGRSRAMSFKKEARLTIRDSISCGT